MFGDDICYCISEECEKFEACFRGKANPGHAKCDVWTSSNLAEICNKKTNYELFMEGDIKYE